MKEAISMSAGAYRRAAAAVHIPDSGGWLIRLRVPDAAAIRIGRHTGAMGAASSGMTCKLHSHILFF